ncbi:MAG: hypothetical protein IKD29_09925 [Lentisphaeria bacterium]|nr:hypothetical protein [Lentisphaeria bacterium]
MGKKRFCRGVSLVESMFAICIMCLLFFALLQIWYWCNSRLFCRYGAYYAAKAKSTGFNNHMVLRAARVASIPASGRSRSTHRRDSIDDAKAYMVHGDGSGVSYQYWHPTNAGDPELQVSGEFDGPELHARVKIRFMTMLSSSFNKIFGITDPPDPQAVVKMYNYSDTYLED